MLRFFLFLLTLSFAVWAAVNINTADEAKLTTLKYIGPKKAAEIVKYRKANGPFKTIEELTNVPGIGPKTVEKLAGELTVQ